ncbi:MAG: phosphatase PAP2 family protein [Ruminococcaceae bacterium]|nr:phosphatase PAP2 family protein [Oscillospiraceae bacterium]
MQVLYWLESIRTPALDTFFSVVTHLGSETLFLAIAIIVFWCVSKKQGYYLLTAGFFGILASQFLKLVCRVPRPWVRDPGFTIVESARADATGYSFPSGHTQNAVTALGCPARSVKSWILRILCIIGIVLTAISRMYLGVHTPVDVLVSLVIGAVLVFGLYPVFEKIGDRPGLLSSVSAALMTLSTLYVIFLQVYPWPADIDAANLAEGVKNGWLLFGCSAAMLLASRIDQKYIRFDVKAPLHAQILKVILGLAIIMLIKEGAKPVLNTLFDGHIAATALRYFLMVIFAACVWPLTFPWFAKGCPMSRRAKKVLIGIGIVILSLIILAAALFWFVTRETKAAPVSTENASNPFITQLGTTMLSGHRAGGGIAPENTMMALQNCVETDAYELDIFEFDIHLTADNVPVLLHDGTLDRTSDAVAFFGEEDVKVGEKTLAELKKLNMGAKFKADDGSRPFADLTGDAVPDELRITTLDEALSYLESAGEYRYIIEVKNSGSRGEQAADILYETLCRYDALDRTVVGTFHNEVTAYIDTAYPDMLRSAGFNECIDFYLCSLLSLPVSPERFGFVALQIPTTDYVVNLGTSRVINYAHRYDIAVQYWTINDPAEMARLQSIGADAVMTDVPDAAAAVIVRP